MMADGGGAKKSTLFRLIIDILGVLGGLIALFQFVVSDDVSSQWFRPTRDGMGGDINRLV
ncbi:hypothetical protein ACFYY8_18590 [Streptosporangium sp. NPDC001559]|uniref:hypothetical protein n=1 Tax=Streptosporangium sp. NPDC001559 TaxID=3366187 RepID=UPI0036E860FA